MYQSWSAPLASGGTAEETALVFDEARAVRLLVLPPLFDEHNALRRQLAEVMRRLALRGIDCFMPDLPGLNESLAALDEQTLDNWRHAAAAAARHFAITHIFAMRGGALLIPSDYPVYAYAPVEGRKLLGAMLRARTVAAREAGRDESRAGLLEQGRKEGLTLAGWNLSAEMINQLENAEPALPTDCRLIEQSELGGSPLWLRAEPDDDPEQADALAAALSIGLMGQ